VVAWAATAKAVVAWVATAKAAVAWGKRGLASDRPVVVAAWVAEAWVVEAGANGVKQVQVRCTAQLMMRANAGRRSKAERAQIIIIPRAAPPDERASRDRAANSRRQRRDAP
jgi:hypothetical protein